MSGAVRVCLLDWAASYPSLWQQEDEMWLCWLPVLMDALTSVSQHCGGNRGGVVLVSLCDFPLQPDTAACGETFSHHAHEHDSGGAFENHWSLLFWINPGVCHTLAKLLNWKIESPMRQLISFAQRKTKQTSHWWNVSKPALVSSLILFCGWNLICIDSVNAASVWLTLWPETQWCELKISQWGYCVNRHMSCCFDFVLMCEVRVADCFPTGCWSCSYSSALWFFRLNVMHHETLS